VTSLFQARRTRRRGLGDGEHRNGQGRQEEGDGIDDGHAGTADDRVQASADQRADESQRLTARGQRRIGIDEGLVRHHLLQQPVQRSRQGDERHPVEQRHRVHDPDVCPGVHRQQGQHRERRSDVSPDQHRAAFEPVDHQPEHRGYEGGQRQPEGSAS
jgi:hypothetical protein